MPVKLLDPTACDHNGRVLYCIFFHLNKHWVHTVSEHSRDQLSKISAYLLSLTYYLILSTCDYPFEILVKYILFCIYNRKANPLVTPDESSGDSVVKNPDFRPPGNSQPSEIRLS